MAKLGPVTHIVVHHSASPASTTFEQIRKWHVEERQWDDIGYHFVILGDGSLRHGRDLGTRGAHAPPNTGKIGVCVVGNNTTEEHAWNAAQVGKLRDVLAALRTLYPDAQVCGHRDATTTDTTCPGIELSVLGIGG